MVDDELKSQPASGRAARALIDELREQDVVVIEATSDADGQAVVVSDHSLEGILLDWTLGEDDAAHNKARALLAFIRGRKWPGRVCLDRKEVMEVNELYI